jgi:hypothetical protein
LVVATSLGLFVVVWVIATIAIGALLGGEHASTGANDYDCSETVDNSGPWAPSTWSWWPPGKICHFSDGTTREPGSWRGVVVVALAGTAATAAAAIAVWEWNRRDEAWWPYNGWPRS